MTFYITKFNMKVLSKSFINLRLLRFIDITKILEEYDSVSVEDKYVQYIINEKIETQIKNAMVSKRYNGIVYSNPNVSVEIITNIFELISDKITDVVFIDKDVNNPDALQSLFQQILYFPTGKRKHIIQCVPIQNKLWYWLNGIDIPENDES